MKCYGGVHGGNKWLNFGSVPDHQADCPSEISSITQQVMSKFD